jgi:hypothetical protein
MDYRGPTRDEMEMFSTQSLQMACRDWGIQIRHYELIVNDARTSIQLAQQVISDRTASDKAIDDYYASSAFNPLEPKSWNGPAAA